MNVEKIAHQNPVFDHYHFSESGFSCNVFPHLGGSLHGLVVDSITIIKEIELTVSGIERYHTKYPSAILFPYPNRVENGKYTFEDKEYQFPINEPANQNSIHGLVASESFTVSEVGDDSIILKYAHESSLGFPFPFDFEIQYLFTKKSLAVQFTVTNTGTRVFPFGMGWHPYFEVDNYEDSSLRFNPTKTFRVNEKMIPLDSESYILETMKLKNAQLDTAYQVTGKEVSLHTSQYDLVLSLPEAGFLQLYTPEDRKSIAIEPMSCIANAFNNEIGLKTLEANTKFTWVVTLEISPTSNRS